MNFHGATRVPIEPGDAILLNCSIKNAKRVHRREFVSERLVLALG
jgi:hypothetical protein